VPLTVEILQRHAQNVMPAGARAPVANTLISSADQRQKRLISPDAAVSIINSESPVQNSAQTVAELFEHYRQIELIEGSGKTARTIGVYEQKIRRHILPKWGACEIGRVKTVAVEAWLKSLPGVRATNWRTCNKSQDAEHNERPIPACKAV
jgi:hypothetical protein